MLRACAAVTTARIVSTLGTGKRPASRPNPASRYDFTQMAPSRAIRSTTARGVCSALSTESGSASAWSGLNRKYGFAATLETHNRSPLACRRRNTHRAARRAHSSAGWRGRIAERQHGREAKIEVAARLLRVRLRVRSGERHAAATASRHASEVRVTVDQPGNEKLPRPSTVRSPFSG